MKHTYIFIILLLCNLQSYAIDRQAAVPDSASWEVVLDTTFQKSVSFALGFTKRIDQTSMIDHKPTIHFKVYSELTQMISLKFGVGYNHNTNFKEKNNFPSALIRNFYLEAGVRWAVYKNKNSLFVENGLEYNTYNDPIHSEFEQRIGINATLGVNLHIYSSYYIDLAIGHTVNNIDFGTSEVYPENSTDPNINMIYNTHVIGIRGTDFYEELYSPTFLRMLLFIKL